jgi:hypothetical protein
LTVGNAYIPLPYEAGEPPPSPATSLPSQPRAATIRAELQRKLTPPRGDLADPFAGLLPARPSDGGGGLGLWITYRSCDHVSLDRRSDGFTIRLAAGDPRRAR